MYSQDMLKGCGPILVILIILAVVGLGALLWAGYEFSQRVHIVVEESKK